MDERFHEGRIIGVVLSALIGLCALTMSSAFAKFSTRDVFQDEARAARFSVFTEMSEEGRIITGDGTTVLFTVKNGDGTAAEVAIAYDVAVSLPQRLETIEGFSCKLACNDLPKENVRIERSGDTVVYTFLNAGSFEAGKLSTDRVEISIFAKPVRRAETFLISIDVLARQTE